MYQYQELTLFPFPFLTSFPQLWNRSLTPFLDRWALRCAETMLLMDGPESTALFFPR